MEKGAFRVLVLLALIVAGTVGSSFGQTYPRWFLDQAQVLPVSYVGYARVGYRKDSSVAYALRNACENAARQQTARVSGAREHWATEIGNIVMTDSVLEEFDTTRLDRNSAILSVVDAVFRGEMVVVLAAAKGVQLPATGRTPIALLPDSIPAWVSVPSQEPEYLYASGLAPGYFYEMSSWQEAERAARKNLALVVFAKVKSVQRVAEQGIEKSREEVAVSLDDVQLVARWRDVRNNVMHVLVRMRK